MIYPEKQESFLTQDFDIIDILYDNDGWWFYHHSYLFRIYGPYDNPQELCIELDMMLRGFLIDYWHLYIPMIVIQIEDIIYDTF